MKGFYIPIEYADRPRREGVLAFTGIALALALFVAPVSGQNKVSVIDFGAVADSSADATPAFNAAFSTHADTVVVPPGIYRVDGKLAMASSQLLLGAGQDSTRLVFEYPSTGDTDVIFTLNTASGVQDLSMIHTAGGVLVYGTGRKGMSILRSSIERSQASTGALVWLAGGSSITIDSCRLSLGDEIPPGSNAVLVTYAGDTARVTNSLLKSGGYVVSVLGDANTFVSVAQCSLYQTQSYHGDVFNVYHGSLVCDSSYLEAAKYAVIVNPSTGIPCEVTLRSSEVRLRDGGLFFNESTSPQTATLRMENVDVYQDTTNFTYTTNAVIEARNVDAFLTNITFRLPDIHLPAYYFVGVRDSARVYLTNVRSSNAGLTITSPTGLVVADGCVFDDGYPTAPYDSYVLYTTEFAPGTRFTNCVLADSNTTLPVSPSFVRIYSSGDSAMSFVGSTIYSNRHFNGGWSVGAPVTFDTCWILGESIYLDPARTPAMRFDRSILTISADSMFTGAGSVTIRNTMLNGRKWPPEVVVDKNNRPPVFLSVLPSTSVEDQPLSFRLVAADPDTIYYPESVWYAIDSPSWIRVDSLTGEASGTPRVADLADSLLVVRALDVDGATVTLSGSMRITHVNHEPDIASFPSFTAQEDTLYRYQVVASDPDTLVGDVLTYSLTKRPSWLTVNALGLVSGVPLGQNVGDTVVTVRVNDGKGGIATQSWSIRVSHTNHAPVFVRMPDTVVVEDSLYETFAYAQDQDSALFGDRVRYRLVDAPTWLRIDSISGVITGTPSGLNARDTVVKVMAYDIPGRPIDDSRFTIHEYRLSIEHVNHPVEILSTPVTHVAEDSLYRYQVVAVDPDTLLWGDVISYRLQVAPSWLQVDTVTGLVSGIPRGVDVGDTVVTVRARDGKGGGANQTWPVRVAHTNHPPLFVTFPDTIAVEDSLYQSAVYAQDPDSALFGDIVRYRLVNPPSWLTVDSVTGVISGTPRVWNLPDTIVTVEAFDGGGARSSKSYSLSIVAVNGPPMLTSISARTATEDSIFVASVEAVDKDLGFTSDTLRFELLAGPAWLSIDAATGQLLGTPGAVDVGEDTVRIRVADAVGASYDSLFVLSVAHTNHAPVFVGLPDTIAVEDSVYRTSIRASDPDSALFGDHVRYRLVTAPVWLSIDSVTGELRGVPSGLNARDTVVTIQSFDVNPDTSHKSLFTDYQYPLTIIHTNHSPTIASVSDSVAREDSLFTAQIVAADVDVAYWGDTLRYRIISGPSWLTVDSLTGVLSGSPGATDVGTSVLEVGVTDGLSPFTFHLSPLTVLHTNHPPVFSGVADTTAVEDALYQWRAYASDADSALFGDLVRYRLVSAPSWLSIDSLTGTISGIPRVQHLPDTVVTVEAYDINPDTSHQSRYTSYRYPIAILHVNHEPDIASFPSFTAQEDTLYRYQVVATDVDTLVGDVLTYSLTKRPKWLQVNTVTGLVSGIPGGGNVGDTVVTVRVNDGKGGIATQSWSIRVSHTNHPPVFYGVVDTVAVEDSLYEWRAYAFDQDSALFGDRVRYRLVDPPSWLSIDSISGVITGTPSGLNARDTVVKVMAYDIPGRPIDDSRFTIHEYRLSIEHVNHPVEILSTPVTHVAEDSLYRYQVVAVDPDTLLWGDVISYRLQVAPSWLQVDTVTGLVSGIPRGLDVGDTVVTVRARDGKGGGANQTWPVRVTHTNHPPVFVTFPDTIAVEDSLYQSSAHAQDPDSALFGDIVWYRLVAPPSWLTIDSVTGVISGTPIGVNARDTVVTVEATELPTVFAHPPLRAALTYRLVVRLVNHAPTITSTPDTTLAEDELYRYTLTAVDPDELYGRDSLRVALLRAPSWLSIDSTGWTMTGVPRWSDVGSDTISVAVVDKDSVASVQTWVLQISAVRYAPDTPVRAIPADSAIILLISPPQPVRFVWYRSFDKDEEDTLWYAFRFYGPDVDTTVGGLRDTSILIDLMPRLRVSGGYRWSVTVGDGRVNVTSLEGFVMTSSTVSEVVDPSAVPERFDLKQNYPNPFNPSTAIAYDVPVESHVQLRVYSILGQRIQTVHDGVLPAGHRSMTWEASSLPTGVYFLEMTAAPSDRSHARYRAIIRMSLIR